MIQETKLRNEEVEVLKKKCRESNVEQVEVAWASERLVMIWRP